MNFWISHFYSALKYVFFITPIYICIRYMMVKNKKINLKQEIYNMLLALYLFALYSQTIFISLPSSISNFNVSLNGKINTNVFTVFLDSFKFIKNGNYSYFLINLLGNIIFFIPIGILVPIVFKNIKSYKIIITGFIISLSIELFQLLIYRATDIDDIILNTLGVFLGYLIYKIIYEKSIINLKD